MLITKILSAIIVIVLTMGINSNAARPVNPEGLALIKRFEGFRRNFYTDSAVIATSNAIYRLDVKFVHSQFDTWY